MKKIFTISDFKFHIKLNTSGIKVIDGATPVEVSL